MSSQVFRRFVAGLSQVCCTFFARIFSFFKAKPNFILPSPGGGRCQRQLTNEGKTNALIVRNLYAFPAPHQSALPTASPEGEAETTFGSMRFKRGKARKRPGDRRLPLRLSCDFTATKVRKT